MNSIYDSQIDENVVQEIRKMIYVREVKNIKFDKKTDKDMVSEIDKLIRRAVDSCY